MIEYSVLCQAIDEWKRGQRPSSGPHAAASGESFEVVEEMNSGIVMLEDSDGSQGEYAQAPGDAEAVAGDGQVEGEHGYQGETEYAATGDQSYSGDTDHSYEADPETGEVAEQPEASETPEGGDSEDEIPIDTTDETKPTDG